MEQDSTQQGDGRSYRDGTIMGLTAAEAFMLISFIMLLLLAWSIIEDVNRQDELTKLQQELQDARKFEDHFDQEQRRLALSYRERLLEFEEFSDSIDFVIKNGIGSEIIEKSVDLQSRFGTFDLNLVEERLRLVDSETHRMAEIRWMKCGRRRFNHWSLVRIDDFGSPSRKTGIQYV